MLRRVEITQKKTVLGFGITTNKYKPMHRRSSSKCHCYYYGASSFRGRGLKVRLIEGFKERLQRSP